MTLNDEFDLDIWVLQTFSQTEPRVTRRIAPRAPPLGQSQHRLGGWADNGSKRECCFGAKPYFKFAHPGQEVGSFVSRDDFWLSLSPSIASVLATRIRLRVTRAALISPQPIIDYATKLLRDRDGDRERCGDRYSRIFGDGRRQCEVVCACNVDDLSHWELVSPDAERGIGTYEWVVVIEERRRVARLREWRDWPTSDLWLVEAVPWKGKAERMHLEANGVVSIALRALLFQSACSQLRHHFCEYGETFLSDTRATRTKRVQLNEASRAFLMATEHFGWAGMTVHPEYDEPIIDSILSRIGFEETVDDWNEKLDRIFQLTDRVAIESELRTAQWTAIGLLMVNIAAIVGTVASTLQAVDGDTRPNTNRLWIAGTLACCLLVSLGFITFAPIRRKWLSRR